MQTRFGKYELKRPLGSGASGTVYCALDTFSRKEVALKVFDPKVLHDPELGEVTRGQFMNEAALAGQLSHPHIVSIFALDLAHAGRLSVYQREIADSEKFGVLRKSELFGRLNDAHLWEIVHSSRWARLPTGTTILRENQAGQNMFLLGAGEVKVSRRGHLLNALKAGDCFGEMAIIRGAAATRNATIEASTDVLIGEFDFVALSRLSEGCRLQIAHGLLRTLVERLDAADIRLSQSA